MGRNEARAPPKGASPVSALWPSDRALSIILYSSLSTGIRSELTQIVPASQSAFCFPFIESGCLRSDRATERFGTSWPGNLLPESVLYWPRRKAEREASMISGILQVETS